VGTFGGVYLRGGLSGTLMCFSILSILVVVEMYQTGRLSLAKTIVFLAIDVAVIGLGEVKAVFLLLPLALAVQQTPNIAKRPFIMGLGALVVGLVLFGIARYYRQAYWDPTGGMNLTFSEQAQASLGYFFDVNYANYTTGEVSRGASLALWWNDPQNDILHRVFGYGAGASRTISTISTGVLSTRYGSLNIAATSLSQLLWDGGLIGAICFPLAIVTGGWRALRRGLQAPDHVASMRYLTIAGALAMYSVVLMYNFSLTDDGATQLMLATLLGLLIDRRQESRRSAPARAQLRPA